MNENIIDLDLDKKKPALISEPAIIKIIKPILFG